MILAVNHLVEDAARDEEVEEVAGDEVEEEEEGAEKVYDEMSDIPLVLRKEICELTLR